MADTLIPEIFAADAVATVSEKMGAENMIDLQQFCATDDDREYLKSAFSDDAYTYATNGHYAVRVPKIADVIGHDNAPREKASKLFADNPLLDAVAAPAFDFPEAPPVTTEDCAWCDADGKTHDCPCCECVCEECDGKGTVDTVEKAQITIHGTPFNARYIRQIFALPGLKLPPQATNDINAPMPFSFDGGEGLLMPMRDLSNDEGWSQYGEAFPGSEPAKQQPDLLEKVP